MQSSHIDSDLKLSSQTHNITAFIYPVQTEDGRAEGSEQGAESLDKASPCTLWPSTP